MVKGRRKKHLFEFDPYVVKLEEIISTEHPLRRAYEAQIAKTRTFTDKALRDYYERNQGLGMKTTNFILGMNRAPQYTLEEYLAEIEESHGYSAKYKDYVQKTGQLIDEVEKARAEATSKFEVQEAERKQENIKEALEKLLEDDEIKEVKQEELIAEEHLERSLYEEIRANAENYVDEALAYHQTYVLTGKIKIEREQSRLGKIFRRKEQTLTPPKYALSEYLYEVKTNQGYSEKYVEYLKATGKKIADVEVSIAKEMARAELAENERRQAYLEQSAEVLKEFSEQDLAREADLNDSIEAECRFRNRYAKQLEQSENYVQKALEAFEADEFKERTLAEHEHVLRYTLQEYEEEIAANQGYSAKYAEYVRATGQRNSEVEKAINAGVERLKEQETARKNKALTEFLAEMGQEDPRKAVVLNSLLEKERIARNHYETEQQKLATYLNDIESVTARRESYAPQYARNEYLAEIQANHGYSPKYLEDLRRTGNEQRDPEIETAIEEAIKRYEEQEGYRRDSFIPNLETEVEKLDPYVVKLEEIISTEHPLRREDDAQIAKTRTYTDKALRDYEERNQGLGMKTTNFIFGVNRPPQYTLEEYLTEIEVNYGYSPKYEEYVQKTGQLIDEVEKARAEATFRFETQEAERKQANIKEALENLLEDDKIKEAKLEELIAEEHLNRNLYEETRANTENYVDEALAYHRTYVLTGRIKVEREQSRLGRIFRRKEQTLTPPDYVLNEYLYEVKTNQGYSEKYVEHLKATGEKIEEVEVAIAKETARAELAETERRQAYLEQSAEVLKKFSEQDLAREADLNDSIEAECRFRNRYAKQLEQSENYVQKALAAFEADEFKERTLAEHEHVLRYTLQEYEEEIAANQGYSAKYEEYVRVTGQRNSEVEKTINAEVERLKEQETERKNKALTELLAGIGQEDPRKAVVLNSLLEKERIARNHYETEQQKLATYLNDIESVTARRESYEPLYTRHEYLAEIQANHGYSPKYLEDLRRTGNEQRDPEIEAAIEEAIKSYEEQEGYRRDSFIHNLETEVEKLDPYVVKLEEIISTEHPLRRAYDAQTAKAIAYTDKALRDYYERNQGLGMKTTNFILGMNRAPQYTLEEYLAEIEESHGYSAKYKDYVQKTGQLIDEVEKARAEATSKFEVQEAERKQENIKEALEKLLEDDEIKEVKQEELIAEEHLERSLYEEIRANAENYVDEALAYHQTYVLTGKIKIEREQSRLGKIFRRKEQTLTPPKYALSEYLYEVKTNQGYSEKYVEYLKATGKKIADVEVSIAKEIARAEVAENERRQKYIEQSAEVLKEFSEQDLAREADLNDSIEAECRFRNRYAKQLEHGESYVQKALEVFEADEFKERTLAEHEHVLRYTLQEYEEEIAANQGYSAKYEEYARVAGQRNLEVEKTINAEVERLKEQETERKNKALTELLVELGEKDPRKAVVLNNLLEKERATRNKYESERQKLAAYLDDIESVTARRESYEPLYTRNEYLAEIQANHGYSPKYLEDLGRTGNEQRDPEIEAAIEEAIKSYEEQEGYRRDSFIHNLEAEVEKFDPYIVKLEEIISTEHPLRREYDAQIAKTKTYADKALRDNYERNQGLGMKTTNFIFGANRSPQYTLEEYLVEIEESHGYSAKYEEYVQKTGQLIDEVEKARAEATSKFEIQEAERKQENIKEALEKLLEDDEIKEIKLEELIAEEHISRSLYEEKRANTENYVDDALAYHETYVLTGRIKIEREKSRLGKIFRRKEQTLTPPDYVLNEYLYEVKTNQGYSEKYNEHLKATGEKIEEVEVAIALEIKIAELAEIKRRQAYLEQGAEVLKEFSEQDFERKIDLRDSIETECQNRNRYLEQLEQSENYVQDALEVYEADEFKERTIAENEHVFRHTLQGYEEEIAANQGYSAQYEEYVRVTGQRNLEVEKTIKQEVDGLKEQETVRKNKALTELLAEMGQEDPRKAVVLNNLLEKERVARNHYETEQQKLAAYLNDIESVTAQRESYEPLYTRHEYLAEIQANHGYSPKYLEDLRRTGNEQRDQEIEATIEEAIKRHEEQETYRREHFINDFEKSAKEKDRESREEDGRSLRHRARQEERSKSSPLFSKEIEKAENEIRILKEIEEELKNRDRRDEVPKEIPPEQKVKFRLFYVGLLTNEFFRRVYSDGVTDTGIGSFSEIVQGRFLGSRGLYHGLKRYLKGYFYNCLKKNFLRTKDGKLQFCFKSFALDTKNLIAEETKRKITEKVFEALESDGVTDTGLGSIGFVIAHGNNISGYIHETRDLIEFLKGLRERDRDDEAIDFEDEIEDELDLEPETEVEIDEEELDEEFQGAKEEIEEIPQEFESVQEELERLDSKGKRKPSERTVHKAKEIGKQIVETIKEKGTKTVHLVRGTGEYGVLRAKEAGTRIVEVARDVKTKAVDVAKKADEAYERVIDKHFSEDAILGGGSGKKAAEPAKGTDAETIDVVKEDRDDDEPDLRDRDDDKLDDDDLDDGSDGDLDSDLDDADLDDESSSDSDDGRDLDDEAELEDELDLDEEIEAEIEDELDLDEEIEAEIEDELNLEEIEAEIEDELNLEEIEDELDLEPEIEVEIDEEELDEEFERIKDEIEEAQKEFESVQEELEKEKKKIEQELINRHSKNKRERKSKVKSKYKVKQSTKRRMIKESSSRTRRKSRRRLSAIVRTGGVARPTRNVVRSAGKTTGKASRAGKPVRVGQIGKASRAGKPIRVGQIGKASRAGKPVRVGQIGKASRAGKPVRVGQFGKASRAGKPVRVGQIGKASRAGKPVRVGQIGKASRAGKPIRVGQIGKASRVGKPVRVGQFGKASRAGKPVRVGQFGKASRAGKPVRVGQIGKASRAGKPVRVGQIGKASRAGKPIRVGQIGKASRVGKPVRVGQIGKASRAGKPIRVGQISKASRAGKPIRVGQIGKASRAGKPIRVGQISKASRVGKPIRVGQISKASRVGKPVRVGQIGKASRVGKPVRVGQIGKASRVGKPVRVGQIGKASRAGKPVRVGQIGKASRAGKPIRVGQFGKASRAGKPIRVGQFGKASRAGKPIRVGQFGKASRAGKPIRVGQFGKASRAGKPVRVGQIGKFGRAGRVGRVGVTGTAEKAGKTGIARGAGKVGRVGSRLGRLSKKGLRVGWSAYGVATGDPIEIAYVGAKGAHRVGKAGAKTGKFGAKAVYHIGQVGAKFTYRLALKTDKFLLTRSHRYGKFREGATGTYRLGKVGAKYAYRTTKVIGGFVYAPIKESATKVAKRIGKTRAYRLASKSYKLSRSTYGVLRAGPVETIKAGAKVSYRVGKASAKFTYRQAIKVDKFLLKKSRHYGKVREGAKGVYRVGKTGAKYAYRTPKVMGRFVYDPLKSMGVDIASRVKRTRAYRLGSKGYRRGQQKVRSAKAGAKATYRIGRAGALRAYRMSTAPFRFANRFAQRSARMALRAMMHIARLIAVKAAAVVGSAVASIAAAAAPVAVPIIVTVAIILAIVLLIYGITSIIFPTNFILVDQEVLMQYIEQVGIYDGEFVEEIGEIKKEAAQKYIYACPSRDIKDRWGVIPKAKRTWYNEGIHVIYENIEPADGHICTDWQGVIALAAVLNQQTFEFSQKEQELIRQIHGKLNRVEKDIETLPCPCYRSSLDYDGRYFTGPCYSHDYEAPEIDPNLPEEEKAAKEAEKEYIERRVIPNLSPCCSPHCTSEWGCYAVACCPGHRRLNIHVYIYELDEEIQINGEKTTMLEEILKEYGYDDTEREWWANLMRQEYDLNDQFPGFDVDQYRCQYKYIRPAGLPDCWPDEWGYPSRLPVPLNWKPRNWPADQPFDLNEELSQVCPSEQGQG